MTDIIDTYIVTYLGAVCDVSVTKEFENQFEIYAPEISFNVYNNIMYIVGDEKYPQCADSDIIVRSIVNGTDNN